MLEDLLLKNRSYRRFFQNIQIPEQELTKLVGLTRYCASARNAQPLKYILVTSPKACADVFPFLSWAGYLTEWEGPQEGERPAAYLIQLLDTQINENCLCDDGIQVQTILLGAIERGWGGCMIKAFKNDSLRTLFKLPEQLKIMYVIALGKPKEEVVLEKLKEGDFKYWRDEAGTHHVPKRALQELIYKVI